MHLPKCLLLRQNPLGAMPRNSIVAQEAYQRDRSGQHLPDNGQPTAIWMDSDRPLGIQYWGMPQSAGARRAQFAGASGDLYG